jgi:hypothetical protein
MKYIAWLLLLTPNLVTAQTPKGRPDDQEKRIEEFLKSVSDLQVEFRADIQLTAIEAEKVSDQKIILEILNHLIESADEAKFPYKLISEQSAMVIRQDDLARSLNFLNVDTLSIKTRAIRSLAVRNREEALRELQNLRLTVPSTGCKSVMVPDVHDYYQIFSAIGNATLGANSKSREQYLFWTTGQIGGISSPVELPAAISALLELNVSANEFQNLADAFVLKLGNLQATDREMRFLESNGELSKGLERLGQKLQEESWPVFPLLESYKVFLERSAKQSVCEDVTTDWKLVSDNYYRLYKEFGADTKNTPDFYAVRRTAQKGGTAEVDLLPDYSSLYDGPIKLVDRRRAEQTSGSSTADKASLAWESDLADSLKSIDALNPSMSPCPACVFTEKSSLLSLYFDVLPTGDWKDKVLERLVNVLADESMEKNYPVEWLFRLYVLLNTSRVPSPSHAEELRRLQQEDKVQLGLPSEYGPRIRHALQRTGSRTLNSYVIADEVFKYEYVFPPHPN